jgi:hypothetical protein
VGPLGEDRAHHGPRCVLARDGQDGAREDHALCIVGFWLWLSAALAPLKGGSLNEQRVRLGDGELGAEAIFL